MEEKIKKNIKKAGIPKKSKILCAVSGGIDSSVMLHILQKLNFECVVAHCNFQLRAEESDRDEKFVKSLAEKYNLKFLTIKFDTHKYAEKMQISIQMAARDLRYEWFYNIAKTEKCDYIAIAHNSDDQIETSITNLIRGTGIRGLTGMQFVKETLFRPLLFSSRAEIKNYAKIFGIENITDSTNLTTKYSRNKIRHLIFPLMAEINPSFKNNILKSIEYLQNTEEILKDYVKYARERCCFHEDDKIFIKLDKLNNVTSPKTVLFEILLLENVPKILATEAINLLESQSGKKCSYNNTEILHDRNLLIVSKIGKKEKINISIGNTELYVLKKYGIEYKIENIENINIIKSVNYAFFDFDKIKFPLNIRNWEKGDKFVPFGMMNFKKVSDFFIDSKISVNEKNNTLIITSKENIIWIVGQRIDNRYKISEATKNVLILHII
ncbi:MAG: tRNA lysidine(34) synthetase TilS [Bacteroidales bacterium]|jgi:tRNA(Ile)-lysidine synthase|nr:tRNA lysidine(34) synthetase TilS [Bacteroidales bacterium]